MKSGKVSRRGVAIVGRFSAWPWGKYPEEACLADALELLDLRVVRVSQDAHVPPDLSTECAVFTGHPSSFSKLKEWKKSHPTALWAYDLVPGFPEFDVVLEAAREADLFMSADRFGWAAHKIKSHGYLPAACASMPITQFSPPTIPFAFIGSVYSERRDSLAALVRRLGGIVLDKMSSWRYGHSLSGLVQNVKVVVGDNARNDIPGYWSSRNYLVPGSGGFLLTPYVPDLEKSFLPDREIAVYHGLDELESKMLSWARNDQAREDVRQAGYARTRKDHNWEERAKAFLIHLSKEIYVS